MAGIIWCGGEEIDFSYSLNASMSAANYRTGYARGSITMNTNGSYVNDFLPGSYTSLRASFRIYFNTGFGSSIQRWFGFGKGPTTGLTCFRLGIKGVSGGYLALVKYNGTTETILQTSTAFRTDAALRKIDFILDNYGSSAHVRVYVDGVPYIDFTGDVTVSGVSDLDMIIFSGAVSTGSVYISEIIVADSDLNDLFTASLCSHVPSSNGDSYLWTGVYTNVSELSLSDTTVIYSNTIGQDSQLALSNTPSTGVFSVLAVKVTGRVTKSADSTPGSVYLGLKTNGTVYPGVQKVCSTSWENKGVLFNNNPVTGVPFTQSEVDALQLNVRAGA